MNDGRLDDLLRKAKVAKPSADQTEELVVRIRGDLARRREIRERVGSTSRLAAWRWLAGGLAVVLGVLLVIRREPSSFAPSEKNVAEMRRYLGELQSLFPDRLDAVVFEPGGPRIVLSESPMSSGNDPLVLRVCVGHSCREIVTFSGRSVEIDGRNFEVLAGSGGAIIVAGEAGVWTSSDEGRSGGLPFRVQARHLL